MGEKLINIFFHFLLKHFHWMINIFTLLKIYRKCHYEYLLAKLFFKVSLSLIKMLRSHYFNTRLSFHICVIYFVFRGDNHLPVWIYFTYNFHPASRIMNIETCLTYFTKKYSILFAGSGDSSFPPLQIQCSSWFSAEWKLNTMNTKFRSENVINLEIRSEELGHYWNTNALHINIQSVYHLHFKFGLEDYNSQVHLNADICQRNSR